jgi:thiol-disulfide isomerase/thioredoxin
MSMMTRILLLLSAVLSAAPAASADDQAAKIAWVRDPQFALARAKVEGRVTMLYFTAEWCAFCRQLGTTVLADDKVVAATQRLIPVYLDCTKKGDNTELMTRYKVQGFPTILYVDADGGVLREMESRDASAIVKDIDAVIAKVAPRTTLWQPSIALAKEAAKKAKKAVAIYLADPKADLLKASAKLSKDLGDRKTRFAWILESGQPATLKKYDVETASMVIVVDPRTDDVLAKILIKDDDKPEALNKALDDAARLLKK